MYVGKDFFSKCLKESNLILNLKISHEIFIIQMYNCNFPLHLKSTLLSISLIIIKKNWNLMDFF